MKAALRPTGGRLGRRNRSTPIFTVRRVLSKVHADISSGAKLDPRKAQTVELRLFAGLSVEETAVVLKVSPQSFSAIGNRRRPGWPERWAAQPPVEDPPTAFSPHPIILIHR